MEAETLARTLDIRAHIDLLNRYAGNYYATQPAKAIRYAEEAIALATKLNYAPGQAQARAYAGYAWYLNGEYRKGVKLMESALGYFQTVGDTLPWMTTCFELGEAATARSDTRNADKYRKEYDRLRLDIQNRAVQRELAASEQNYQRERLTAEMAQLEKNKILQSLEEKDAAFLRQQLEVNRL
ncbi:MAG: hypothetical protein OHK0039_13820 [Bacteroidia bacterium]